MAPPEQTFKQAMRARLEDARREEREKLDKSLLGTLRSSRLGCQDYALDPAYIMRERVREYQKAKQTPHAQFVRGMVPDDLVADLDRLEKRKAALRVEKPQINLNETAESRILAAEVERTRRVNEERLRKSAAEMAAKSGEFESALLSSENAHDPSAEEPEEDAWDSKVVPKNSWLGKTARALHNPGLNCQLYLREEFPDVFRVAQREYYGLE